MILDERDMQHFIEAAAMSGTFDFILPVAQAAMAGTIDLCLLQRGASWPRRDLRLCRRPTLLLVGDDDDASTGPSGWPPQLRTWPTRAMIHASGGCHRSYRLAVANCIASGRYALIETDSAHMLQWVDWFVSAPSPVSIDLVRPAPGEIHPQPVVRSAMQ